MALEKILTPALNGDILIKNVTGSGSPVLSERKVTPTIETVPKYKPAQSADCPFLKIDPIKTASEENVKESRTTPAKTERAKLNFICFIKRATGNIIRNANIIRTAPDIILEMK